MALAKSPRAWETHGRDQGSEGSCSLVDFIGKASFSKVLLHLPEILQTNSIFQADLSYNQKPYV